MPILSPLNKCLRVLVYNRAYLSRIFKQETGLSPVTYLLKLRIDKSRQLLRERPDLSIEQVSASVGLPDALYFSKQFKRFHGEAPSLYRERNTVPTTTSGVAGTLNKK